ncbi:MAG: DNA gyrase subunit B, partial [Edaphobacter sp.]
ASEGMVIRYGDGGATLEGAALTKFMTQLNDYLGFFDKVQKRLRNEEVTKAFAETFAQEGKDSARRVDFESPAKLDAMRTRLQAMEKTYQFKHVSDVVFDEERQMYSVNYTDAQGAVRPIDWALASAAESRQMLAKHAQIREELKGPFLIEYSAKTKTEAAVEEAEEAASEEGAVPLAAAPGTALEAKPGKRVSKAAHEPVEKKTAREVFEYVIEQGRKEYQVQRYKGLGEMTAPQLWDTTMDPERRTLLQVKLEDIAACEEIFTTLMGEDVESRRKFIEENALDVKNLDI